MRIKNIILIITAFLIMPLSVSALSFSNLSSTSTSVGSIGNGNGYFDDPRATFNYSDTRNIYVLAESTQVWIVEPISYVGGASNTYALINSSVGAITDAVVHNGYLYFVDNAVLKKKKTRNIGNICESTDTTAGGCVSIIVSSNVGNTLRVHNNILYYTSGTSLKHLDSNDNTVSDFVIGTIPGGEAQFKSFAVTTNGSSTQVYATLFNGADVKLYRCISTGCVAVSGVISSNSVPWTTLFTSANYVYFLDYQVTGGSPSLESTYYISNSTAVSVDYVTTNTLALRNRVYVGGQSVIGLITQTTTTYDTFNFLEAGQDSLPLSEGSGIVSYISKTVEVPNPTYYNDSVIPMNVNLKFIITDSNHTNYSTSAFWHLHAFNPTGIEVEDHDLPIICTQQQPWWDPFGVFTLFIVDNVEPWACDGTQTVNYVRSEGQFWINGTWTVELTEQVPGTTSVLSFDTWNIVNQTSGGTGSISQTPESGGGLGGQSVSGTDITNMLSSKIFWTLVFIIGIMLMVSRKERQT